MTRQRHRPPMTRNTQTFHFMSAVFNVDHAIQLTEGRPIEGEMEVEKLYTEYVRSGFIGVKEDYAMSESVDLTKPIICAWIFHKNKPMGILPIDGWHRIFKAWKTGVEKVPYRMLTKTESKLVQVQ